MYKAARPLWRAAAQIERNSLFVAQRRALQTPPPNFDSEGERVIYNKLEERFQPSRLQVQDVSGGCGSFYAITIASKAFANLPMIKQHRLVNDTLKKEIEGIHGLQLKTIADSDSS